MAFPLRLESRCLVISTCSSFSFQRRSNPRRQRRFLASTASYCSLNAFASYSSCLSLLTMQRVVRHHQRSVLQSLSVAAYTERK